MSADASADASASARPGADIVQRLCALSFRSTMRGSVLHIRRGCAVTLTPPPCDARMQDASSANSDFSSGSNASASASAKTSASHARANARAYCEDRYMPARDPDTERDMEMEMDANTNAYASTDAERMLDVAGSLGGTDVDDSVRLVIGSAGVGVMVDDAGIAARVRSTSMNAACAANWDAHDALCGVERGSARDPGVRLLVVGGVVYFVGAYASALALYANLPDVMHQAHAVYYPM